MFFNQSKTSHPVDQRAFLGTCLTLIVVYCVVILWYVATFPDVGIRCLLPESRGAGEGIEIRRYEDAPGEITDPAPRPGDSLRRLNGQPISTYYDFALALQGLRFAKIPPGGQLAPGSDPGELKVPPLVEIYSQDPGGQSRRMVEVIYVSGDSETGRPGLPQRAYLPVRPVRIAEISMTIIWFGCQLSILALAMSSWWYRPSSRVTYAFCLMSCFSMGAFVPGFHWWMLVGNPLLNVPFIICAGLLPALILDFFLVFPRESDRLRDWRRWAGLAVYLPMGLMSLLIVLTYWSGWALNGRSSAGELTVLQKLAAISQLLFRGSISLQTPAAAANVLLSALRLQVQTAIGIASLYFAATVFRLGRCLLSSNTPRERRQVVAILCAALLATVPIGYTLFLAFFREVDFALGSAQLPMFIASMLFMAAYSHGMLRDRLMLAEDVDDRGRRYVAMSLLVSGGIAVVLACGGVMAHLWSLPLNSSTTQQISLFLILLLATGLCLWARDRLQAVVDRRFFSEKYQLDRAMQALNRSAAYLADPSAMAELTLRTCADVMASSWSMMFVRDGHGTFRLIGSRGAIQAPAQLPAERLREIQSESAVIPRLPAVNRDSMDAAQQLLHSHRAELLCRLVGDDGLHGIILLGRRESGLAYSAEDFAFLQAMAQMSVLALHSSRANQTMARLNAELKSKMENIAEQQRQLAALRAELTNLQQDAGQHPVQQSDQQLDREGVRGASPALLAVLDQVRKVARSTSTVLIRGESGTGKELLARVIHRNSDRANENLICVNCAALSPSLLESELFGHVRGAFTGAHADKPGRFQAAHNGTLFLDEIGDVPLETQVKLLRVLQERKFEPVGSDRTVEVDVRLVAATNRNLEELIRRGQFREDFFYRLNVVPLTLPPLRERREDLAELVFYFLSRSARKTHKQIRQIDPAALEALELHAWPGNIRELENVIERAVVLAESEIVTLADLPTELRRDLPAPATTVSPRNSNTVTPDLRPVKSLARRTRATNSQQGPNTSRENPETAEQPPELTAIEEEQLLRDALRKAGGNKAVAARSLNLARSTFFSKCRRYGIS
ncbi:MAG: Transcriptional regulatory protein ZraR [Planctomycetota bacterium]